MKISVLAIKMQESEMAIISLNECGTGRCTGFQVGGAVPVGIDEQRLKNNDCRKLKEKKYFKNR